MSFVGVGVETISSSKPKIRIWTIVLWALECPLMHFFMDVSFLGLREACVVELTGWPPTAEGIPAVENPKFIARASGVRAIVAACKNILK